MKKLTFTVPVPSVPNPHLLTKAREASKEMQTTREIRRKQKQAEAYDKKLSEAIEVVDRHEKIMDEVENEKRKLRVSRSMDPGARLVKDMAEHLTSDGTEYEVS